MSEAVDEKMVFWDALEKPVSEPVSGRAEPIGNVRLTVALMAILTEDSSMWTGRALSMTQAAFRGLDIDLLDLSIEELERLASLPALGERARTDPSPQLLSYLRSLPGFPASRLDPDDQGEPAPWGETCLDQHGYMLMQLRMSTEGARALAMAKECSERYPGLGLDFYALRSADLRAAAIADEEARILGGIALAGVAGKKSSAL